MGLFLLFKYANIHDLLDMLLIAAMLLPVAVSLLSKLLRHFLDKRYIDENMKCIACLIVQTINILDLTWYKQLAIYAEQMNGTIY